MNPTQSRPLESNTIHYSENKLPLSHPAEASPNTNFSSHKLIIMNPNKRFLSDRTDDDCSICLDPFTRVKEKKIKRLNCEHFYHDSCFEQYMKKLQDKDQAGCPICRKIIKPQKITTYQSSRAVTGRQHQLCVNQLCFAKGTEKRIKTEHPGCPYPLSVLIHHSPSHFLEANQKKLTEWILYEVERKGFKHAQCDFKANFACPKFSDIHNKTGIMLQIYYEEIGFRATYLLANDINKGTDDFNCFERLLKELRTDLLFNYLISKYRTMFDDKKNLFIYKYKQLDDNKIFLKSIQPFESDTTPPEKKSKMTHPTRMPANIHKIIEIRMGNIFEPLERTFSWDKLREELEAQSLSYESLFLSSNASSSNPEAHKPPPSGLLNTDSFLF